MAELSQIKKLGKKVIIEWQDVTVYFNKHIEKVYSPIRQITIGFLVKTDKKFKRVAFNINENGEGDFIDIPVSLIINETEL
ncbi:MAG: hypothetical protein ACK4WJ_06345 [Endomicrobiia bacterium]